MNAMLPLSSTRLRAAFVSSTRSGYALVYHVLYWYPVLQMHSVFCISVSSAFCFSLSQVIISDFLLAVGMGCVDVARVRHG